MLEEIVTDSDCSPDLIAWKMMFSCNTPSALKATERDSKTWMRWAPLAGAGLAGRTENMGRCKTAWRDGNHLAGIFEQANDECKKSGVKIGGFDPDRAEHAVGRVATNFTVRRIDDGRIEPEEREA